MAQQDSWGSVVFLGLVFYLQAVHIVLSYISRDALFVKTFGKDRLPFVILTISAFSGVILKRYSSVVGKKGLRYVLNTSYFLFGAIFIALRLLVMVAPILHPVVVGALYIWAEICSNLITGPTVPTHSPPPKKNNNNKSSAILSSVHILSQDNSGICVALFLMLGSLNACLDSLILEVLSVSKFLCNALGARRHSLFKLIVVVVVASSCPSLQERSLLVFSSLAP